MTLLENDIYSITNL